MQPAVYAIEAAVEAGHWWFRGRRRLFARLLERHGFDREAPVLDVGTGTGSNLRMLERLGCTRVTGVDASPEAIRWCEEKGLGRVQRGDVGALPFADGTFHWVLATDVIEHVDDDRAALGELRRVLVPGGRALITVPAFAALWGHQDEVAGHRRRYRLRPLLERVAGAGLEVREAFHFNYLLFVPIWAARRLLRLARIEPASENALNPAWLNAPLSALFALDVLSAPWLRPPFGVSIAVVAERPA